MYYVVTRAGVVVLGSAGSATGAIMSNAAYLSAVGPSPFVSYLRTQSGTTLVITAGSMEEMSSAYEATNGLLSGDGDKIVSFTGSTLLMKIVEQATNLNPWKALAVGVVGGLLFDQWMDFSRMFWRDVFDGDEPVASPLTPGEQDQLIKMITQGYFDSGNMCINPAANDLWQRALNWKPTPFNDPLALDLDGDGIETLGVNDAVVFDHSGENLINGTGWVKGDDGFLVLDRNDNGIIDNGGELFGIYTTMSNGQNARSGFQALADFDTNLDGVMDANDEVFANLKVWQDLNENAVTDAGELKTLTELNIASISLNATAGITNLGNGNQVSGTASYTRTDGTTGTAYNLDLAINVYEREYKDDLTIPEGLTGLPNMSGTGRVRDLMQAAIRNQNMASILGSFSSGTTRAAQMAVLDSLVQAWANTSNMKTAHQEALDTGGLLVYQVGVPNAYYMGEPAFWIQYPSGPGGWTAFMSLREAMLSGVPPEYAAWLGKIGALERFNGEHFVDVVRPDGVPDFSNPITSGSTSGGGGSSGGSSGGGTGSTFDDSGMVILYPVISEPRKQLLEASYTTLLDSVYGALVVQTRLKPYLDAINITLDEASGLALDFSGIQTMLEARRNTDAPNAYIDLVELNRYAGGNLYQQGWGGMELLNDWLQAPAAAAPEVQAALQDVRVTTVSGNYDAGTEYQGRIVFGGASADNINMGDGRDNVWAGDGADTVRAGEGDDVVFGNAGNDSVYGELGRDILFGGDGNDTLNGDDDDDILYGESGVDILSGGAGNDVLDGGVGNETNLIGGAGSDTYLFGLGDGQDTIMTSFENSQETVRFKAGVNVTDIRIDRNGGNAIFVNTASGDKVTIQQQFSSAMTGNTASEAYRIDVIEFADGTRWTPDDVVSLYQQQHKTSGNDTLDGFYWDETHYMGAGNDTASGLAGNDTLYGEDGADTLNGNDGADNLSGGIGDDKLYGDNGNDFMDGGTGNDQLYGGSGNDALSGGAGADTLTGAAGNDTYLFERAGGADTVTDTDATAGNTDQLLFDESIAYDQLWFKHVGTVLEISVIGTSDKVSISNWYSGASNHVERLQMVDGHYLLDTQVEQLVQAMAGMTPPPLGQTNLTVEQHQQLDSVYATTWQTA